ncbi:siderophore-interacting protein [Nocardioides sp. CBS4Y-1]|uniref:Siderophore-interacting protein n=2 Tax=Nocardioides acrostichi TaxID=2784339 RepID=A0A930YCG7_9ACTN|nr:siderophore-interacting protein [Nocardioides acrostichi]
MRVAHAEVVDVTDLTPGMRRVVLGGPGLADYESTGVGDEYVRVLFPRVPQERPALPGILGSHVDYSTIDVGQLRCYTVRAHEPGRVSIDVVLHEGGVAASWARQAAVGQVVVINTPVGLYDPPEDIAWQVLVADHAGVPAALRIMEQSAHVRTVAVLEVPGPDYVLPTPPAAEVRWLYGGNGAAPSALENVVRALPPSTLGEGYVWVAGETRALRPIRAYLRRELGLPATAYKIVGYWTRGAEEWRERYEALPEDVRRELEAMWESGRDEEEIEDDYELRLDELGL